MVHPCPCPSGVGCGSSWRNGSGRERENSCAMAKMFGVQCFVFFFLMQLFLFELFFSSGLRLECFLCLMCMLFVSCWEGFLEFLVVFGVGSRFVSIGFNYIFFIGYIGVYTVCVFLCLVSYSLLFFVVLSGLRSYYRF